MQFDAMQLKTGVSSGENGFAVSLSEGHFSRNVSLVCWTKIVAVECEKLGSFLLFILQEQRFLLLGFLVCLLSCCWNFYWAHTE